MHPKGADSMAVSGLGLVKPLVSAGWAPPLHEQNQFSHLAEPPFLAVKLFFPIREL